MDIQNPNVLKFFQVSFSKNEVPPPPYIVKVSSGDEVIRQVPSQSEIKFKEVLRENSIVDIYV